MMSATYFVVSRATGQASSGSPVAIVKSWRLWEGLLLTGHWQKAVAEAGGPEALVSAQGQSSASQALAPWPLQLHACSENLCCGISHR